MHWVATIAVLTIFSTAIVLVPVCGLCQEPTCLYYEDYLHSIALLETCDARDIAVSNNFAYLVCGSVGLIVIDITDPGFPVVVGALDTPGIAKGIEVVGNYAFIADGESGLLVVSVEIPASPAVVGSADSPGLACNVAIVQRLCLCCRYRCRAATI